MPYKRSIELTCKMYVMCFVLFSLVEAIFI